MASPTSAPSELDRALSGDTRALARLLSLVEDGSPRVREVIKELLPRTGHARIIGLTGSEAEIAATARAFRAVYMKVPTEGDAYTMEHTAIVYLMNGQGRLAGTIAYGEAHDAALDKVKRLLAGG